MLPTSVGRLHGYRACGVLFDICTTHTAQTEPAYASLGNSCRVGAVVERRQHARTKSSHNGRGGHFDVVQNGRCWKEACSTCEGITAFSGRLITKFMLRAAGGVGKKHAPPTSAQICAHALILVYFEASERVRESVKERDYISRAQTCVHFLSVFLSPTLSFSLCMLLYVCMLTKWATVWLAAHVRAR